MSSLRVIILKPGKYDADGYVQRFRRGFMPNSTLADYPGLRREYFGYDLVPLPRSLARPRRTRR